MSENTEATAEVAAATEEAEVKKTTAKKRRKTAKKAKKAEKLMYVGPTTPKIGIQNRVYTEIPQNAQDVIKVVPEISNLFIPVLKYAEANKMIREQNGYIWSAYLKALEIKGGK